MIVEITGLEEGIKVSRQGKELEGVQLFGIKIQDGVPSGEYDRFVYRWANPNECDALMGAGIGARVSMQFQQEGRFQNLAKVTVVEKGSTSKVAAGAARPVDPPASTKVTSAIAPPEPTGSQYVKVVALDAALSLTRSFVLGSDSLKKLLPATKTTAETLKQLTLENAADFEAYLSGEVSGDVASKTKDLDPSGVDAGEPSLPNDDEDED
jgi:hypothetical protein